MAELAWDDVVGRQATLVSTRKRDGTWVPTAVSAVRHGSIAYFLTAASSGKTKRIANFPEVQVASCTYRGEPTGPAYAATARRLQGAEATAGLRAIRAAHPVIFGVVIRFRYWVGRSEPAVFELSELRPLA